MKDGSSDRPQKPPAGAKIDAAASPTQAAIIPQPHPEAPGGTGATSFARASATAFICGVSLGVIAGLSVAPVVGTVVAGLITLVTGLLTVGRNFRFKMPSKTGGADNREYHFYMDSPVGPEIALLSVGLVAGAMAGIYIRNNDMLGRPVPAVPDAGPATDRLRLARADNDRQKGSPEPAYSGLGGSNTASASVLFASQTSGACAASLGTMTETELRRELSTANRRMGAFLTKPEGAKLSRAHLVVLAQTFTCPQLLSESELTELRRDRNRAASHYNPIVSRLGRDLGDYDLLLAVLTEVLGPSK